MLSIENKNAGRRPRPALTSTVEDFIATLGILHPLALRKAEANRAEVIALAQPRGATSIGPMIGVIASPQAII